MSGTQLKGLSDRILNIEPGFSKLEEIVFVKVNYLLKTIEKKQNTLIEKSRTRFVI